MNNNVKAVSTHLEQEVNWVNELNAALAEEKLALINRQFASLEALAATKQDLSVKIEESAKLRIELMGGADANELSLSNFLKGCNEAEKNSIKTLNNKLLAAIAVCQELNLVNGQVIASNLYTRQQIVNVLSNKSDAVGVYTATGDMKAASDNGHHQEA